MVLCESTHLPLKRAIQHSFGSFSHFHSARCTSNRKLSNSKIIIDNTNANNNNNYGNNGNNYKLHVIHHGNNNSSSSKNQYKILCNILLSHFALRIWFRSQFCGFCGCDLLLILFMFLFVVGFCCCCCCVANLHGEFYFFIVVFPT